MGLEGTWRRIVNNKLPDLAEKYGPRPEREAQSTERTLSYLEARENVTAFVPEALTASLSHLTSAMESGTYLHRVLIGKKGEGTAHPHDFVIEKDTTKTSFYFLDPEHHVGVRTHLRPPVDNIMSLTIHADQSFEFAIMRMLTPRVADKNMPALKMAQQLEAARSLIEKNGIPSFAEDAREDIRFRLVMKREGERGAQITLQSHDIDTAAQNDFISHGTMRGYMQGKATSQRAILNHFKEYLEKGLFVRMEHKQTKNP